jgi:hypothetical protein
MAKLFKVTKNDNSPFIVHTKGFDVKYWELSSMLMSERSIKLWPLTKEGQCFKKVEMRSNLLPNQEVVWNSKNQISN